MADGIGRVNLHSGTKVEIERSRTRVSFIIECTDEYSAIELYDQATAEARAGKLDLRLVLNVTKEI